MGIIRSGLPYQCGESSADLHLSFPSCRIWAYLQAILTSSLFFTYSPLELSEHVTVLGDPSGHPWSESRVRPHLSLVLFSTTS